MKTRSDPVQRYELMSLKLNKNRVSKKILKRNIIPVNNAWFYTQKMLFNVKHTISIYNTICNAKKRTNKMKGTTTNHYNVCCLVVLPSIS